MRLNDHELEATTLRDLIRLRGRLGDKPLAIVDGNRLTYQDADESANRIANSLAARGIRKGDVVATLMHNSADHICLWFACAKIGAIWAPLNIALVKHDLAYTINDTGAQAIIVDADLLDTYLEVRAETAGHDRAEIVRIAGEAPVGWTRFGELLDAEPAEPDVMVAWSDPAGLIYTGGTTGLPKGVLVSNLWYFPGCLRYQELFRPGPNDVHMGLGQMCHTIGSAVDILCPMYWGMTTITTRWFSVSRFWDTVRANRVTLTVLLGTLMTRLLAASESEDDADNSIRLAASVTGGVPREVVDRFSQRFGIPLLEIYGQTETGPLCCIGERIGDQPYPSQGSPHGWADMVIADPLDRPCPAGQTGEILLRPTYPSTFMLGYLNKPDKFAEACRNLWFHTGDLGHLDDAGYLHFDGRMAHTIRHRGENVSALEIEQVVLAHPAVANCAVVGVPGAAGEDEIKAYVQLQEGAIMEPDEVVKACAERIAFFKIPRYVEFVSELPLSVTKGEVERHKLRDRGTGNAWDREAVGYRVRRPSPARQPG
jgi:carnitine-CoA ligase